MADEKNGMESGAGDEEYHFTDDNADYDLSSSAPPAGTAAAPAKSLTARLKDSRRILIGAVIFLLLLGVVYRMLVPTGSSPAPSEFVQNASTATNSAPVEQKKTPPAEQPPAAGLQQIAMPTVVVAPVAVPATSAPVNVSAVSQDEASALSTRISGVEQQNAAILNTLQTQYTQKLSDLEAQNTELHQEIQDLKMQVSEVKDAFHKLSILLQRETAENAPVPPPPPFVKNNQTAVHTGYSVQAIIPGRAWLKSDSGETVTVAEGDTLRGVGRVVRIDPYDGVVNLDTGHKIITLSYGMGADE